MGYHQPYILTDDAFASSKQSYSDSISCQHYPYDGYIFDNVPSKYRSVYQPPLEEGVYHDSKVASPTELSALAPYPSNYIPARMALRRC